jgi:hypothetical protein
MTEAREELEKLEEEIHIINILPSEIMMGWWWTKFIESIESNN